MATPSEKLAESLETLKALQDKGIAAISSSMLSRTHRQRLLHTGFLSEACKGWYIAAAPETALGDTTSWYSTYWDFCGQLLEERFNREWCISPEQSLLIHGGSAVVPVQQIIRSPLANNSNILLPAGTSLFLLRSKLPGNEELIEKGLLRMYSREASLVHAAPAVFKSNPVDTRAALSLIADASAILNILLQGGHSAKAGRLAGAFRNIGRSRIADDITAAMKSAGYTVIETDPFENPSTAPFLSPHDRSPYANRVRLMWQSMRGHIIPFFPPAPGLPPEAEQYMNAVGKIYITDAYHSLSIEKYKVTPELIEKVRAGNWDKGKNEADKKQRDAMAARGYWDAFVTVEKSIRRILSGENAGMVSDLDHSEWYRQLFGPSVAAGILEPFHLAGYRTHQVFLSGSRHTPLNKDAVRDTMPVLFELLSAEKEPAVRAVLGHFIFVYIHPYMDGNGRMGRLLMNTMLASGGYPWTVIPLQMREEYMQALEQASAKENIEPFAAFLGNLVKKATDGTPVAKI